MSKTFIIAVREYFAAVKTKAFVISVVLLPVMLFGTLALRHFTEKMTDLSDRHYAIIDRTPGAVIFDSLNLAVTRRNEDGTQIPRTQPMWILERVEPAPDAAAVDRQRYDLSQRVRKGELSGFVEIPGDVLASDTDEAASKTRSILYQTNGPTYFDFREFCARQINEIIRTLRLKTAGLDPRIIDPLLKPVPMVDRGLARIDPRTGAVEYERAQSGAAALLVPFGLVMLMFMVVIVGAIPMMQGVIEEKQQRIAEVLLASVTPFELMAGKLLGMTAVSLTLISIYGIGGLWGSSRFHLASYAGVYLTPSLFCWFGVMQLLAVLMFGSMYIAIGASCTDMKEAQALLLPLNLLIMLPLMLVFDVIQHPNSSLARWSSLFPTAAPMLTIARIAVPPGIPLWEKLLPVAIVAATTVLFIWAGGRIFRVGMMAGKAASFPTLLRWIIKG